MMPSFLSHSCAAFFLFLLLCFYNAKASSSSSSARIARSNKSDDLPLYGLKPDKFVASAPLIVAAVCQDGVAIVATHTASLKEPLLMDESSHNDDDDDDDVKDGANTRTDSESSRDDSSNAISDAKLPKDIALSFRGPFRIQSVDGVGTTLACAGWRTDGEMLAAAFRSLASSEQDRFGEPSNGALQYGRFLAHEASTWMAKCAVSDTQRPLSCVGLLASGGREKDDTCCLWLVDATGAYRVRAHAVGLGAKIVNERLRRIDFAALTREKGALRLLETIAEEPSEKEKSIEKETTVWKLPDNTRVEVAVVAPLLRKMNRIRLASLVSEAKEKA